MKKLGKFAALFIIMLFTVFLIMSLSQFSRAYQWNANVLQCISVIILIALLGTASRINKW